MSDEGIKKYKVGCLASIRLLLRRWWQRLKSFFACTGLASVEMDEMWNEPLLVENNHDFDDDDVDEMLRDEDVTLKSGLF